MSTNKINNTAKVKNSPSVTKKEPTTTPIIANKSDTSKVKKNSTLDDLECVTAPYPLYV